MPYKNDTAGQWLHLPLIPLGRHRWQIQGQPIYRMSEVQESQRYKRNPGGSGGHFSIYSIFLLIYFCFVFCFPHPRQGFYVAQYALKLRESPACLPSVGIKGIHHHHHHHQRAVSKILLFYKLYYLKSINKNITHQN